MQNWLRVLALANAVIGAALPDAAPVMRIADASSIHYLGRVNPATKELTWPSTGLSFNFTGTTAIIGATVAGDNSVDLYIDGVGPTVIANVTGSITIPTLPRGAHSVIVRKRSEAYFGSIFLTNVLTDGRITKQKLPSRQIEFIGDSTTVGYGLDGVLPCINTAALEDNGKTFAAIASDMLDADYSVVAWSGKGAIRNYVTATPDYSPLMTELYTKYGANDPDYSYTFSSEWKPDVVVVNLGTNDFSYLLFHPNGTSYAGRPPLSQTLYTNTMLGFLRNVQAQPHYGGAQFFLLSSPLLGDSYPTAADAQHTTMVNSLQSVVATLGKKFTFVDWPSQPSLPLPGCDYHPNSVTNAVEGEVLAAAIKARLGW